MLVVGSSVFPYYPYFPGEFLAEGTKLVAITSDPDEAARAPMGDAIVADVKLTLQALVAAAGTNDREPPSELPAAPEMEISDPLSPSTVCRILNEKLPDDAIIVLESPSSTMSLRNQLRISKPVSYTHLGPPSPGSGHG